MSEAVHEPLSAIPGDIVYDMTVPVGARIHIAIVVAMSPVGDLWPGVQRATMLLAQSLGNVFSDYLTVKR